MSVTLFVGATAALLYACLRAVVVLTALFTGDATRRRTALRILETLWGRPAQRLTKLPRRSARSQPERRPHSTSQETTDSS